MYAHLYISLTECPVKQALITFPGVVLIDLAAIVAEV